MTDRVQDETGTLPEQTGNGDDQTASSANHGSNRPSVHVDQTNPDCTVDEVGKVLAGAEELFDRGKPVRATVNSLTGKLRIDDITPDALVVLIHRLARPYKRLQTNGPGPKTKDVQFPRPFAKMCLDLSGELGLRPLNGVTSAPVLQEGGGVDVAKGYDQRTGLIRLGAPDIGEIVSAQPSSEDAKRSLEELRRTFKTFCFADAPTVIDPELGTRVVDIKQPPGMDESALMVGLLTAVCRPSLWLAPGLMIAAPLYSGSGTGKGLLARCISMVAFGEKPHATTAGESDAELEKRIVAELVQAEQVLFLDNINDREFKSDLLASVITERPARVRILGQSQTRTLNSLALVVLTGNGLTVAEDLVRRFIKVELDAGTDNPDAREFGGDILADVEKRRPELLAALLTIWRWGQKNADLHRGQALGSFEQWCRWCRDPMLALGCQDPVKRIKQMRVEDSGRVEITEIFEIWWECHQDRPVMAKTLDNEVTALINPFGQSRQFLAAWLKGRAGTRVERFVLKKQPPIGSSGVILYRLEKT